MQTIDHLAQVAGISLVSGIWQGFLLAAGVWLCLRLVPRTSAALRFAVWIGVFAIVAFLPLIESQLRVQPSGSIAALQTFQIDARLSLVIIALWAAFSLFRAADLAIHAIRLWTIVKRSTPVMDTTCAALLSDGRRTIALCTSTEVDRPSVIGFFAPHILIPARLFKQLSSSELKQIVLHEVEHLRRRDDWLNLLQKLSLILFPLNPILIWVERRLCFERELACDDGVLRRTRAPRAYATCLTNLAERGLNHRTLSLALGALGIAGPTRQSELARRIFRILSREATLSPLGVRALTGALAMGLAGGAAGLAHYPHLISFVPAPSSRDAAKLSLPTTRFNTPARSENVVYRATQHPRATLLSASFPEPALLVPAGKKSLRARKRPPIAAPTLERNLQLKASVTVPNRLDIESEAWIVLSSWSEADRPRLVLPVATQILSVPHYAAVPTEGGWLIIQL